MLKAEEAVLGLVSRPRPLITLDSDTLFPVPCDCQSARTNKEQMKVHPPSHSQSLYRGASGPQCEHVHVLYLLCRVNGLDNIIRMPRIHMPIGSRKKIHDEREGQEGYRGEGRVEHGERLKHQLHVARQVHKEYKQERPDFLNKRNRKESTHSNVYCTLTRTLTVQVSLQQ